MSHRLRRVNPPLLRLALILLCYVPAVTGMPHLERFAWGAHEYEIMLWLLYALVIAWLVRWELGKEAFRAVYGLACYSAMLLIVSGGILTYFFKAVEVGFSPEKLFEYSKNAIGLPVLWNFSIVLAVIPLGLMLVTCFPPEETIRKIVSRGRLSKRRAKLLLWMRIASHAIETTVDVWASWKEEMPSLWRPQVAEEANNAFEASRLVISRLHYAILAAASALLVGTLEPLPLIDAEIEALMMRVNL